MSKPEKKSSKGGEKGGKGIKARKKGSKGVEGMLVGASLKREIYPAHNPNDPHGEVPKHKKGGPDYFSSRELARFFRDDLERDRLVESHFFNRQMLAILATVLFTALLIIANTFTP